MSKKELEKLIKKKKGYITTKDLKKEGIHREYLSILVEEEKLTRTAYGVYQSPNVWEDKLFNFQQKKGKMIYSHDTALYLHGLSDRDPIKYAVTLPTGYNTSQIKKNDLVPYTIQMSLFELGKIKIKSPYGNVITTYDKERTICDIIRSRNRLDKNIVNDGIKAYMKDPEKNLNKLVAYAIQMNVFNILKTYMDILL